MSTALRVARARGPDERRGDGTPPEGESASAPPSSAPPPAPSPPPPRLGASSSRRRRRRAGRRPRGFPPPPRPRRRRRPGGSARKSCPPRGTPSPPPRCPPRSPRSRSPPPRPGRTRGTRAGPPGVPHDGVAVPPGRRGGVQGERQARGERLASLARASPGLIPAPARANPAAVSEGLNDPRYSGPSAAIAETADAPGASSKKRIAPIWPSNGAARSSARAPVAEAAAEAAEALSRRPSALALALAAAAAAASKSSNAPTRDAVRGSATRGNRSFRLATSSPSTKSFAVAAASGGLPAWCVTATCVHRFSRIGASRDATSEHAA